MILPVTWSCRSWRIARQHASLLERAGAVYIQDHGSLTGVHLNGKRVYDDGPLRQGDVLGGGGFKLRITGFGQQVPGEMDAESTEQS